MSKRKRSDVLLFKTFDSRKGVPSISKMRLQPYIIILMMITTPNCSFKMLEVPLGINL